MGIRVNDKEYEPTRRMEMYSEYLDNAVYHVNQAMHELGLAETQLDKMPECGQMVAYSTIVVLLKKMLDQLADDIGIDFEEWTMDENTVANHHFWSEDDA
jgi:hypothetical protein